MSSNVLLLLHCCLSLCICQITIITSGVDWQDDYQFDENGINGWHIYKTSQMGSNITVYYSPQNIQFTVGANKYHGVFDGTNYAFTMIQRYFQCSTPSHIEVEYRYGSCNTGPNADSIKLYEINEGSLRRNRILDEINTPINNNTEGAALLNYLKTNVQDTPNWYANRVDWLDVMPSGKPYVLDGEQFLITLMMTITDDEADEYGFVHDIGIRCNTTTTTAEPSSSPTAPSVYPTRFPTTPSAYPTTYPTSNPTFIPTTYPSTNPTFIPTTYPSTNPTFISTTYPSTNPTYIPTSIPTNIPTYIPTSYPVTNIPTTSPTTFSPTTSIPSNIPTINQIADVPTSTNGEHQVDETQYATTKINDGKLNGSNGKFTQNDIHIVWILVIVIVGLLLITCCLLCFIYWKKRERAHENMKKTQVEVNASLAKTEPKQTDFVEMENLQDFVRNAEENQFEDMYNTNDIQQNDNITPNRLNEEHYGDGEIENNPLDEEEEMYDKKSNNVSTKGDDVITAQGPTTKG